MSDFEFMRNITIGQTLPVESTFRRFDPRTRLVIVLALLTVITFALRPVGLLGGLALVFGLLYLGRIPFGYALSGLIPPLPFLFFIAVLQMFINPLPDTQILAQFWRITISTADLWAGAAVLLRFAGLILLFSVATLTMTTSEMTHGLSGLLVPLRLIGLPVGDLVMMTQVTLRFLPFLAQAAERIAKAQAARGAAWGVKRGNLIQRARQVLPLVVPLFLMSLRRAENMALAMDSRAYNARAVRSSLHESRFGWGDAIAAAMVLAAAVFLLWI